MLKSHSALIQYHLVHIAATAGLFWWLDASNDLDPSSRRVTAVSCFMTAAQLIATAIYLIQTKRKSRQSSQEPSSPKWFKFASQVTEPSIVVISSTILFHLLIVLLGGPLIE